MAAPASNPQPATVAEVREIIAALIVEKNHLLHANDPAAAEAIALAIENYGRGSGWRRTQTISSSVRT